MSRSLNNLILILAAAVLFLASCATAPKSQSADGHSVIASEAAKGRLREATSSDMVFRYVDASGGKHKTTLNPGAKRNDYIKKCFMLQDEAEGKAVKGNQNNGKMTYIGDSRYTSRQGCDISRHDGKVDWQSLRDWGMEFVILRIGYRTYQGGVVKTDENFHENYKSARNVGLDIGVYFFSQAITKDEAIEEADRVIEELKACGASNEMLQLPVVFDPESIPWDSARTDGVNGDVFTMTTRAFCERVESAGYKSMVYSNMIWQADMFDMADIDQWPMWYADYEKEPQSPYAFSLWQYSAFGTVPGCTTQRTDLDVLLVPVED